MSLTEINLMISNIIASYLAAGSWTIIYYGNRFMGIPQGIFAVSLSTVLLPYFSHVTTYAPRRMSYLLLESAKLVAWVTTTASIIMIYFSRNIFITLFLSDKFTYFHTMQAAYILSIYLSALFFFSFHKIIANVYYAFKIVWVPATSTVISAVFTAIGSFTLTPFFGIYAIALSTMISSVLQTCILIFVLPHYTGSRLYIKRFTQSFLYVFVQAGALLFPFFILHATINF